MKRLLLVLLLSVSSISLNATKCESYLASVGSLGTARATASAFSRDGKYLVVVGASSNTIALFNIDQDKSFIGLAPAQIINSGGLHPVNAAFSPDNSILVVANADSDTIAVFSIDQKGDSFISSTPIQTIQLSPGSNPKDLAFSLNGKWLSVVNSGLGTISTFSVDKNKASLSTIPVQTLSSGGVNPVVIRYANDGHSIATINQCAMPFGNVTIFKFDSETGLMTPMHTVHTNGLLPSGLAFLRNNQGLVVVNKGSNNLSVFSIDKNYHLTRTQTIASGGNNPSFLAYSRNNKYLVVPHEGSSTFTVFEVDERRGTVSETPVEIVSTTPGPIFADLSPNGRCFVVSTGQFNRVDVYKISCDAGSSPATTSIQQVAKAQVAQTAKIQTQKKLQPVQPVPKVKKVAKPVNPAREWLSNERKD